MFQTIKYKTGYIHFSYLSGKETITVSVDQFAFPMTVKSLHAAKIAITRDIKYKQKLLARLKKGDLTWTK